MNKLNSNNFFDKVYTGEISEIAVYEYVKVMTNIFDVDLLCQLKEDLIQYCNNNLEIAVSVNKLYFGENNYFVLPKEDSAGQYIQDFKISNFFQFLKNKHSISLEDRRKQGFDVTGNDLSEIEFLVNMEKDIKECTSVKKKLGMLLAFPEISCNNDFNSLIKLSNLIEYQYKLSKSDKEKGEPPLFNNETGSDREVDSINQKERGIDSIDTGLYLNSNRNYKIDFIRVINCLHELGFFLDSNDVKITKKDLFKIFGLSVHRNLLDFSQNMSTTQSAATADNTSLLRIFNDMLNKQKELIGEK